MRNAGGTITTKCRCLQFECPHINHVKLQAGISGGIKGVTGGKKCIAPFVYTRRTPQQVPVGGQTIIVNSFTTCRIDTMGILPGVCIGCRGSGYTRIGDVVMTGNLYVISVHDRVFNQKSVGV